MAPRPRTSPRKAPRQERSRATVEVLLTATARVLVRDGYDRASTNRVAREAGVSVGSLYQYFPSKEALVAALVERHIDRCSDALAGRLQELADQPLEHVARELIHLLIALKTVDPRLERVILEQVPRVGRMGNMHALEARMTEMLTAYLELHQGSLRPCDRAAAALVLVKAGTAVAHAVVLDRPAGVPPERLAEEFTHLVLRYLSVAHVDEPARRGASRSAGHGAVA